MQNSLISDLISSSNINDIYVDNPFDPTLNFRFSFTDNNLVLFQNVIAILARHQNDRSILWRDAPIRNSEIKFNAPGISYLPIIGVIYPGPLFRLFRDYYSGFILRDIDAANRIVTSLEQERDYAKNSSINYGIASLSDLGVNIGDIHLKFYFRDVPFHEMNDWLGQDIHGDLLEDLDVNLAINEEFNDMIQEDEFFRELEAEEEYQANQLNLLFAAEEDLNREDLDFEYFNEVLARDLRDNDINHIDNHFNSIDLSDEFSFLDRDNLFINPSGSGINMKKSKKQMNNRVFERFKRNIEDLILYYPDDSKVYELIKIKNNIFNFFKRNKSLLK